MCNPDALEFTLYEHELKQYNTNDYVWIENRNGNLEDNLIQTGNHHFTWQPHGSQFTIICDISVSALRFKIKKPTVLNFDDTLKQVGFQENWATIVETSQ